MANASGASDRAPPKGRGGRPPFSDEAAGHAVFSFLDPILRALISSIESLSELEESLEHGVEEEVMVLLRKQAELLRRLNDAMGVIDGWSCGKTYEMKSPVRDVKRYGVVVMAEYMLLPLTLILQGQPALAQRGPVESTERRRRDLIRRSAGYLCVEGAARCMATYFELMSRIVPIQQAVERDGAMRMRNEAIVRCLVSCCMAMVNLDESRAVVCLHGEESGRMLSTTTEELLSRDVESLDKGQECHLYLLRCVETIFSAMKSLTANESDGMIQADIASALGGALLARLAEGCLSAFAPRSPALLGQRCDSWTQSSTSASNENPKGNVLLRLQALSTLRAMMITVRSADVWRALLPGTFAALFRLALSQLRFSTVQSSPKVAGESIRAISRLLDTSLSSVTSENDNGSTTLNGEESMKTAASALLAMASATKHSESEVLSEKCVDNSKGKTQFLEEVNKHLPAPLLVLMRLIPPHKSPIVRRSGAELCTSVLVRTQSAWTGEGANEIERGAIECCLSLLCDDDDKARLLSREVLILYRNCTGQSSWADKVSSTTAPRVLELIEGLPLLARGGRDNELRNQMALISGYLQTSSDLDHRKESKRQSDLWGEGKGTDLGLSLSQVSDMVRKALRDLFRPDFDPIKCVPRVAPQCILSQNQAGSVGASQNRFFFLRDDVSAAKAMNMISLFGQTLGEKKGSLFVDGCIAEIFSACNGTKRAGRQQVRWLDRWSGLVVVANEVLVASFPRSSLRKHTHNASLKSVRCVRSKGSVRRQGRRTKILHSLASSILPVVSSPPLWNLPTVIDEALEFGPQVLGAADSDNDASLRESHVRFKDPITILKPTADSVTHGEEVVSATALHGNAVFLGCLMQLIGNMCELLGDGAKNYLPTVLFPLLERTGACNHYHVQQSAFEALAKVARAVGVESIAALIAQNFEYLVDSISLRLRTRRGMLGWSSITTVLSILLKSGEEEYRENNMPFDEQNVAVGRLQAQLAYLFELVDVLIDVFDSSIPENSILHPMNQSIVLGMVNVFDSVVQFLSVWLGLFSCRTGGKRTMKHPSKDPSARDFWLHILSEFEEEGRHKALVPENDPQLGNREDKVEEGCMATHLDTFSKAATVSKHILSRCCFFLCIPDLKIQVAGCEVLKAGFAFLAFVENATQTGDGTPDESIGSPLLTSTSDCWPAISARLGATCSDLCAILSSERVSSSASGELTKSNIEIFFADLLDLVTSMCEISGDFMVSRFENDVWPLLSKVLGANLRNWNIKSDAGSVSWHGSGGRLTKHQNAKDDLSLFPVLQSMSRVFGSVQFGSRICHLIVPAGVMLLPLLSDEGRVGDVTMGLLKSMLSIDNDSLWRALATTGGKPIPSRQLKKCSREDFDEKTSFSCLLTQRANFLLEYGAGLPEQNIL